MGQVMLVVEFSSEEFDAFNSKYRDAAELYKGKNLGFLLGDVNVSEGAVEVILPWQIWNSSRHPDPSFTKAILFDMFKLERAFAWTVLRAEGRSNTSDHHR